MVRGRGPSATDRDDIIAVGCRRRSRESDHGSFSGEFCPRLKIKFRE